MAAKGNVVSQKLWEDAVQTEKMLRSESGNSFNKAYIDNEVAYDKNVINTLENTLIPKWKIKNYLYFCKILFQP